MKVFSMSDIPLRDLIFQIVDPTPATAAGDDREASADT